MSLPTLQTERKIKYENTTTYIKNSGLSALSKVIFINLGLSKSEKLVFKIRYFSYTKPLAKIEESTQKLPIG